MKKWKRRYYRQVNDDNPTTSRSKAKKMLRECRVTPYVRKQLILHNAVIEQIRKKYQETRECKVKSLLRPTVANVQKKYRLVHKVSKQIGVNQTLITQDCGKYLTYQRKTRSDKTDETTKRKIVAFFERDDNSWMLPGEKDTITLNKVKKQKHLLNDSMKALHAKFLYEHPNVSLHYTTFTKLRPFWIVKPSLSDLNTCTCKKCTNMAYPHLKLVAERYFQVPVLKMIWRNLYVILRIRSACMGSVRNALENELALTNLEKMQKSWSHISNGLPATNPTMTTKTSLPR